MVCLLCCIKNVGRIGRKNFTDYRNKSRADRPTPISLLLRACSMLCFSLSYHCVSLPHLFPFWMMRCGMSNDKKNKFFWWGHLGPALCLTAVFHRNYLWKHVTCSESCLSSSQCMHWWANKFWLARQELYGLTSLVRQQIGLWRGSFCFHGKGDRTKWLHCLLQSMPSV